MILSPQHIYLSPEEDVPRILALGFFDGIHRGHKALLDKAHEQATLLRVRSAVLTFLDDTNTIKRTPRLFSIQETNEQFSQAHMDDIYLLPFEEVRTLEPEDFFQRLMQTIPLGGIVCGFNYRFGFNASGDASLLGNLCEQNHIPFFLIPPVIYQKEPISTSRIRTALAEGRMDEAEAMLGRPIRRDTDDKQESKQSMNRE